MTKRLEIGDWIRIETPVPCSKDLEGKVLRCERIPDKEMESITLKEIEKDMRLYLFIDRKGGCTMMSTCVRKESERCLFRYRILEESEKAVFLL